MNNILHRNKITTPVLGICILLFSSCIEIKETLTLKNEGGGNYSFVIYYNQYLNEIVNKEALAIVMNDMYEELDVLKDDLSYMDGISNIETIKEDMGAFGFSFDFIDNKSLNEAMTFTTDIKLEINDKTISHTGAYPAVIKEMEEISVDDLEGLVKEEIFKEYQNAVYTFTVNSYKPMQLKPSGLPEVFSDEGKTVTYTYLYNSGTFKPEDYNQTIYFQ